MIKTNYKNKNEPWEGDFVSIIRHELFDSAEDVKHIGRTGVVLKEAKDSDNYLYWVIVSGAIEVNLFRWDELYKISL